ncbi:MAG: glutamate formimidoyltransferase [bacterium]
MRKWFECVPNVSEGRDKEVVEAMKSAILSQPDVRLLDVESDASHHRSVFTFIGPAEAVKNAVLHLYEVALRHIDLRKHKGEHPRIGAVDVVPFVPIFDSTMAEAVELAKQTGEEIARRFGVPVYLYEEAATAHYRKNLADIRKGEFEGLAEKMMDPLWKPDYGPERPHPSAGASVVGAREILIAYNIYLGTNDIKIARAIARAIRASDGGFTFIKALGFEIKERNQVQVSMNVVNYKKSPLHRVFQMVKLESARYGVPVVSSEIVGLVPADALIMAAEYFLQLENFSPKQILDFRLMEE